jgi:hypothetical protein
MSDQPEWANPNPRRTDREGMNTITYSVNLETEIVTVTAIVEDGKACGAYEVTREYPFDDFGHWLVQFAQDLRGRHQTLHAEEYVGA